MISQARAGVTTWFHNIHNGPTNVSHLTNSSGAVVQKYGFDAFGNLVSQSGTVTNNYRFQSKELHTQSGLVYFGARWYNPNIGRWLTPDPLGIIDGPNVYTYLNNNSINLLDAWGLCGGQPPWGQPWWVKDKKIVGKEGKTSQSWWSSVNWRTVGIGVGTATLGVFTVADGIIKGTAITVATGVIGLSLGAFAAGAEVTTGIIFFGQNHQTVSK